MCVCVCVCVCVIVDCEDKSLAYTIEIHIKPAACALDVRPWLVQQQRQQSVGLAFDDWTNGNVHYTSLRMCATGVQVWPVQRVRKVDFQPAQSGRWSKQR